MEGFEVAKLPEGGIEEFISKFEPAQVVRYNEHFVEEIDNSPDTLERNKNKCAEFKAAIREAFNFADSINRNIPKFCLALSDIFFNGVYVSDSNAELITLYSGIQVKPALNTSIFPKVLEVLGISITTGYRYKEMAVFVDPDTKDYYPCFKGYSFSLLEEMHSVIKSRNLYCTYGLLKDLCFIVPANTSIEDIRLYRKSWKDCDYGLGVYSGLKYEVRVKLKKLTLPEFLKDYQQRLQSAEAKKLEETMSGATAVAKNDKSVKVLPAPDEVLIKKSEYENLRQTVEKFNYVGNCNGCKYHEVNLNKCRCCRRYANLKDLYEG